MKSAPATQAATGADDLELVRRALARDGSAFRTIMERYNRRLYRIARGILRNDSEAEDVVQEAYVGAFAHLQDFRGDSSLATWLSRITINEALGRLRRDRPAVDLAVAEAQRSEAQIIQFPHTGASTDPERTMGATANPAAGRTGDRQLARNVPHRVRHPGHRGDERGGNRRPPWLAARDGVKTRLHRARRLVREQLDKQIGPVMMDAFPFAGRRCQRVTTAVMRRLGLPDRFPGTF